MIDFSTGGSFIGSGAEFSQPFKIKEVRFGRLPFSPAQSPSLEPVCPIPLQPPVHTGERAQMAENPQLEPSRAQTGGERVNITRRERADEQRESSRRCTNKEGGDSRRGEASRCNSRAAERKPLPRALTAGEQSFLRESALTARGSCEKVRWRSPAKVEAASTT